MDDNRALNRKLQLKRMGFQLEQGGFWCYETIIITNYSVQFWDERRWQSIIKEAGEKIGKKIFREAEAKK